MITSPNIRFRLVHVARVYLQSIGFLMAISRAAGFRRIHARSQLRLTPPPLPHVVDITPFSSPDDVAVSAPRVSSTLSFSPIQISPPLSLPAGYLVTVMV